MHVDTSVFLDNTTQLTYVAGVGNINSNWWGSNNPNWKKLTNYRVPDNYVIMNFTNTTPYDEITKTINLNISLNTLNTGEQITGVPERQLKLSSSDPNGQFTKNNYITENVTCTFTGNKSNLKAVIDNQELYIELREPTTTSIDNVISQAGKTVTLNATVNAVNSSEIATGNVVFKINGKTINTVPLINGIATLNYNIPPDFAAKSYVLTAIYKGNDILGRSSADSELLLVKEKPTVTANNITVTKGEVAKLTATICDSSGNLIQTGTVKFKINGKTLPNQVAVINGITTYYYTIPTEFSAKNYSITAVYLGTNQYLSLRSKAILTIEKGKANIIISETQAYAGETTQLKTLITDINGNLINSGEVIFKINGRTLKDSNGNTLKSKVINGQSTLDYTIQSNYSSKNYTLTAVYIDKNYEKIENNNTLTVKRSSAQISFNPIITTFKTPINITGLVTSAVTQLPVIGGKIGFKIDKETVATNLTVDSKGIFNYTIINNTYEIRTHLLEIIYDGGSNTFGTKLNTTITIN
ncbi:MAG: Ig-like domain-containing protein [Methanobacteriaceae archaeon]|nr:Ig-like domain-containing protein [Methanobacteriaceae archaeon]